MKLWRQALYGLILFSFLAACEKKKSEDRHVGPRDGDVVDVQPSKAAFLTSAFKDSTGKIVKLLSSVLTNGGPQEPINLTFAQANSPVAVFRGGAQGDEAQAASIVPFIAFATEADASVSIRHIKVQDGQNVSSQIIVPIDCPETYVPDVGQITFDQQKTHCLPLINAVIRDFLVASDSGRAYVHEFHISVKNGNNAAVTLQTKVATKITIPNSPLELAPTEELRALKLRERLLLHTNDLRGAPRRDFPLLEIKGNIAPGVETNWVLLFKNVKMVIEEEIFFEQPVDAQSDPGNPAVSRGHGFYKRKAVIDSVDHFRIRVSPGWTSGEYYDVKTGGASTIIELPIKNGHDPLWLKIHPDFSSESATKTMAEYFRPFGPTFCSRELATFKPEEWRQSLSRTGFVACEAFTRQRIIDQKDATSKALSNPMETFFGSFSYLPRLSSEILGGTTGVLSYRISLSGVLEASVRNPQSPETSTVVSELDLGYTFQLPTAMSEMEALLTSGGGTPGLDTILSSMQRKGFRELPRRQDNTLPSFPFLGLERDDLLY